MKAIVIASFAECLFFVKAVTGREPMNRMLRRFSGDGRHGNGSIDLPRQFIRQRTRMKKSIISSHDCTPFSSANSGTKRQKGEVTFMKTFVHIGATTALILLSVMPSRAQNYNQVDLVSNTSGVASVTDSQLVNPWGLSRGSGTVWWVSDNLTGVSTLYNGAGVKQSLVVTIAPADPTNKNTPNGTPTGTIFNGSQTDFLLAPGKPSVFLFSTIDGTIAGWNPGVAVAQGATPPSTHAVTVVKTTDGSSYTGLTSSSIDGIPYLYAANFVKAE
jgi:hypothetical protein